jgi:hypothetical protein
VTLNSGIRRVVALLRAHGFATCDSGDGETHDYECDRDHGYVAVVVAPAELATEADRLAALLRSAGVRIEPRGEEVVEGVTHIQASYCPADGVAVIDASPIHDRQLSGAP